MHIDLLNDCAFQVKYFKESKSSNLIRKFDSNLKIDVLDNGQHKKGTDPRKSNSENRYRNKSYLAFGASYPAWQNTV